MRDWRKIAASQAGLITRAQLEVVGVRRWTVSHRVQTERWQQLTPTVVTTTTGALTREQLLWLGVLHAGDGSLLGGLTAAERLGLRNWQRDDVTVLVPYGRGLPSHVDGIRFVRSRRDLEPMRLRTIRPACCRLEPAVLMFAAADRSERTAQGVLAAVVQQRLSTPELLAQWVGRLAPLRRTKLIERTLADIAGGAQSLAEIDIGRMCGSFGLVPPRRQVRRRDAHGRFRFTDCEWVLADGRTLVLEVDGAFHMEVGHWEEDIARQRGLTDPRRLVVRCTSRELRDEPDQVASDLLALGVPRAA
ncbi:MAG TPA: hypothetical protein VNS55_04580 [Nocardioides sp.]|nr:hypothetical protein [Nocardioides sp.]